MTTEECIATGCYHTVGLQRDQGKRKPRGFWADDTTVVLDDSRPASLGHRAARSRWYAAERQGRRGYSGKRQSAEL